MNVEDSLHELQSDIWCLLRYATSQQSSHSSEQHSLCEEVGSKLKSMEEQQQQQQETYSPFSLMSLEPLEIQATQSLMSRLEKVNTNFLPATDTNRFGRHKQSQKKGNQNIKAFLDAQSLPTKEIPANFRLEMNGMTLTRSDLENIKPQKYLNGECIYFYLKMLVENILPPDVRNDVFLHNTYFMTRLLGQYITNQKKLDSVKEAIPKEFVVHVRNNAAGLVRWTRQTNIFQKKYIIFPINLPGHWMSIMVVNLPNIFNDSYPPCCILYMDSLGRKHKSLIEAIRIHLKYQLEHRKLIQNESSLQITKNNLPDYQLLLPRQTNFYDCGPCTLLNIESLLLNPHLLSADFSSIQKRKSFLQLFPKTLIFSMRQRMMNLFIELSQSNIKQWRAKIIEQYMDQRQRLISSKLQSDYDRVDDKEFRKFVAIKRYTINNPEEEFAKLLEFYLDTQYNFFETR